MYWWKIKLQYTGFDGLGLGSLFNINVRGLFNVKAILVEVKC